jgi:peptide/nickel transport system ATP-binding protein
MYAGRIVEKGTVNEIFHNPLHPYTVGLMASKPVINRHVERLYSIPGSVPNPIKMPNYCYFKDRCERRMDVCDGVYPEEVYVTYSHMVTCYHYKDGQSGDWYGKNF